MGCACRHDRDPGHSSHPILPDDACIYCARKHAGLARLHLTGCRQLLLGDLECCRLHLVNGYPLAAGVFAGHVRDMLLRKESQPDILASISGLFDSDPPGAPDRHKVQQSPVEGPCSPLLCELFTATAGALWREPGYFRHNRPLVTGLLASAQACIYDYDRPMALELRRLRHDVEKGTPAYPEMAFTGLFGEFEARFTPAVIDIVDKYGTTFNSYLRI